MTQTGEPEHHEPPIRATIARYDDRPDECTLHPEDPDDEDSRMTEWITAESGYYYPVATCR